MLHVPVGSNTFGGVTNSWGTTRPGTTWGTSITPGSGAKGSYAAVVGTALSFDAYGVLLVVYGSGGSAASRNYLMDVGYDPAGGTSYTVLLPDLLVGGSIAMNTAGTTGGIWYYFPIFVPSGSKVGARAQGADTTAFRVGIQLMQQPVNPAQIRKGSFVEAYGISGNTGTSVTLGTTSEGAWTQIGTTGSLPIWWWQMGYQIATADTSWANAQISVDVAVGDATNKNIIIADTIINSNSTESIGNPPISAGVEFYVKPGTAVYARGQHSGTVDNCAIAVYGMGG